MKIIHSIQFDSFLYPMHDMITINAFI